MDSRRDPLRRDSLSAIAGLLKSANPLAERFDLINYVDIPLT